jgi:hypothetical protein
VTQVFCRVVKSITIWWWGNLRDVTKKYLGLIGLDEIERLVIGGSSFLSRNRQLTATVLNEQKYATNGSCCRIARHIVSNL